MSDGHNMGHKRKTIAALIAGATPGTIMVPLTRGQFALIDETDAEAVGAFNWTACPSVKTFYAHRSEINDEGHQTTISLHRFLWSLHGRQATVTIDHRNGNGLDCRADNMRPASCAQNAWNRGVRKDNSSGIPGVTKRGRRWRAIIVVHGTPIHLGCFDTIEEADRAKEQAEYDFFGAFVRAA